jgi:hypothetical protein
MYKTLDDYIEDIGHYLSVKEGRRDILQEIHSHILERLELDPGESEADALPRLMKEYGPPREVADRYNENIQIIAPSFKRYLVRYTLFLFSLHTLLTIMAVLTRSHMFFAPFFIIPRMDPLTALFYIPMSLVYDAGLVGIILYFLTQRVGGNLRLPWLKVNWDRLAGRESSKARPGVVALLTVALALAVFGFIKQKTIFVYSVDFKEPVSYLNPEASRLFSLVVICLIAVELLTQVLRFASKSAWLDIINNAVWLGAAWWLINVPSRGLFVPDVSKSLAEILKPLGVAILAVIALFSSWGFLKALLRLFVQKKLPADPEDTEGGLK